MVTTGRQLSLQFDAPEPIYRRENFVPPAEGVSPLTLLDAFLASSSPALAITGPAGAGKTFLGRIALQVLSRGQTEPTAVFADALHLCDDPSLLMELIENARQTGLRVMLAGEGDPRGWARGLRDLETRLGAAPRITLTDPDDWQLRAALRRSFLDRQLRVPDAVIDYAAERLAPTYGAVRAFVGAALDELAAHASPINLALARKVVSRLPDRDAAA